MNRNTRSNQWMGWVVGSISLLLLIGAGGLEFFARQTLGQTSVATLLLALYLGSWSYFLGIVGLVLLSVWWLVGWLRVPVKQAAMSRHSPAEPRRRRLAKPEPEVTQFLQHDVASAVPNRLSRQSDARNKAISSAGVA